MAPTCLTYHSFLHVSLILSSAVNFWSPRYPHFLYSYICFTLCLSLWWMQLLFCCCGDLSQRWLNLHFIHLQSRCHCSLLDVQLIDLLSAVEAQWNHRPFRLLLSLAGAQSIQHIQLLSSSCLLSGPLSSVIRVGVCDVRLHPRLQRVLYRVWCQ